MKLPKHLRPIRATTFCRLGLFAAVASAWSSLASASDCSAPEHHQFDFWIGQWAIKQKIPKADGNWFEADATTKVSPILAGCALIEEWKGKVLFFWKE